MINGGYNRIFERSHPQKSHTMTHNTPQSASDDLPAYIANIKHCKLLGIDAVENSEKSLVLVLPYDKNASSLVGNQALSGGAMLTLMDTVCGLVAAKAINHEGVAPTLNMIIDYIQPQTPGSSLLGTATTLRINDTMLYSRGLCYEAGNEESPIAFCSGTFVRIDSSASQVMPIQVESSDYLAFLAGLTKLPNDQTITALINRSPYAQLLGIEAKKNRDQILFILPACDRIIGNNTLPAVHGGCVAGFMEHAALLQAWSLNPAGSMPKAINSAIDFLRPARLVDSYASCEIMRRGRKVTNIRVTMWQTDTDKRIATASINISN